MLSYRALFCPILKHTFTFFHIFAQFQIQVMLLGSKPLMWESLSPTGLKVYLPQLTPDQMPCSWAWTLRLTGVA